MKNQPALKFALILSFGILIAKYLPMPLPLIYSICVMACLLGFLFMLKRTHSSISQYFLILSLFLLGMIRFNQAGGYLPKNHFIHHIRADQTAAVLGTLIKDPVQKKDRLDLLLEIDTITTSDTSMNVKGRLLSTVDTDEQNLSYGQRIRLTGTFIYPNGRRNPGGFDYRAYLARKNIHALFKCENAGELKILEHRRGNPLLRCVIYPARRFILQTLEKSSFGQSRAILQALLVGEKTALSPEVRDDFAKAGVIHLLAVSGLHVGFVLLIFMTIFGLFRLPYPIQVVLTILGLLFYTLLTEGKAPVLRATIMASTYLVGTLIERKTNPFNIIGLAGIIILFINPRTLFDVGFQLSFTAVISILFFYRKLTELPMISRALQTYARHPLIKSVLTILLVSLSAQIGTAPFTAIYFNRVPFLSLLVNIVAIPLIGVVISLGFATILASLVNLWVGQIYGTLNHEILSIFVKWIHSIGSAPFSYIYLPTPGLLQVVAYFSLILFLFHLNHRLWRKRFVFIFLLCLNGIVWKAAIWNNADKLTWIQFDVRQGDAALLHLPRGKTVLIDGGNQTPYFDNGERVIAPYLRRKGIRYLDAVILSHPHNDHVGGLVYIVNHFKIGQILTAGTSFSSRLHHEFLEQIQNKQLNLRIVSAPDSLITFPGVQLTVLSPQNENLASESIKKNSVNNQSLVIRILYGKNQILFMGDAEQEAEKSILSHHYHVRSNAIKLGHHGSYTSSSDSFIRQVDPDIAVISVGENNRYGHPSEALIQSLRESGLHIYRTDRLGALIFQSNGQSLKKCGWK